MPNRHRRRKCFRGPVICHPVRAWLLHGPLAARLAVVIGTLLLLLTFGVEIDRAKVADVLAYAFAELGAHFVGG